MSRRETSGAASWGLELQLEPSDSTHDERSKMVRIVDAIAADVRSGVLKPGAKLPGSRTLAARLRVHRNTVLAAMRELEREGLIHAQAARGTFVSELPPALRQRSTAPPRPVAPTYSIPDVAGPLPEVPPEDALPLLGGMPDLSEFPTAAWTRAYRRAHRRADVLSYGDPAGAPALRRAIADMLGRTRGIACDPDEVLVTRGSQMALDLVARTLLGRDDRVAVEAWGYPPAWSALGGSGAELVGIPVDGEGVVVDQLRARIEGGGGGVRATYVTPHHQYPTTVTLSGRRRHALIGLAREHRFAIIEDDYDHEFHYEGRPVRPLAAVARDVVVYVGTFSKVLAPGLRVGWVVAPPKLIDVLVRRRAGLDRQGDAAAERALAELMDDGELQRHVLRMRRRYLARRNAFVQSLEHAFGDRLRFDVPDGGMAVWAHAPGTDVARWETQARRHGVWFQSGHRFRLRARKSSRLRLGFGALDEAALHEAVRRLEACRPESGR